MNGRAARASAGGGKDARPYATTSEVLPSPACLRPSRFNYATIDPQARVWLLHNFATGRTARLDPLSYGLYAGAPELLARGSLSPESPLVRSLEQAGFLTRLTPEAELGALRHATFASCYGSGVLTLTVCPTLACNFSCPYCYENRRSGAMTQEVQDRLVDFVRCEVERFATKRIFVVWFGGEPLLRPDIVEALSQRLIDVARVHGLGYGAAIITNASLLTPEAIQMLRRCQVDDLQVTLDGPTPATNDPFRRARDGQGSFDRIMGNLAQLPAGFRLKIRCNLNRKNIDLLDDMAALCRDLDARIGAEVNLVPGIMDADVAVGDEACDDAATYAEVGQRLAQAGFLEQDSVGVRMAGRFDGTFCGSQLAHTYVVDELGNLYRCWEDCGNVEASFGNLAELVRPAETDGAAETTEATVDLLRADVAKMARYLDSAWPGDDPQCGTCPILPVCMGGCPHRFMQSGVRRCPWFKDDLDGYVLRRAREAQAKLAAIPLEP